MDVGPQTLEILKKVIKNSEFVLWNGPLGLYEDGFDEGTRELLEALAQSDAVSVVGGGDTVEIVNEMNMVKDFTFVSTGGGATLDFLATGTLPGIEALN